MAQLFRDWITSCEQCTRESRIDRSLNRPPVQNPNEPITVPEYAMKHYLVPELPPCGGFENMVRAMDVFSSNLFAYATSNQDFKTIAEVIMKKMTKHPYLPTTVITDKGSDFMSHAIKEVTGVLGTTLKHATSKQAQTKRTLTRNLKPQNSKEQNVCKFYSLKQIIKQVIFISRVFGGLSLILMKKPHQTIII